MVDPELLKILVCPESHQPLAEADGALVAAVNAAVAGGKLTNVGGAKVERPLDAGLVREDGARIYAVRDDIPVLLVDEGIALPLPAGAAG